MLKHLVRTTALAALLAAGGAQAQSPAAPTAPGNATYKIDPAHTFVTWEFLHFGTSTLRGRFDKKEGTVQFDRANQTGKVDLTIDTTSISTGTPAFDKHLSSKDFFNVATFPTARFVADKFSFYGEKVTEVNGNLTLLGVTKPVTLKATNFNCYNNPMLQREVCGGDFETTLLRSQWGMTWGSNFGMPDNVRLLIEVEAVKQ
jgi:polyisoprenoid-binding protein YceI